MVSVEKEKIKIHRVEMMMRSSEESDSTVEFVIIPSYLNELINKSTFTYSM